ncbi:MAG: chemotaxis protein CheA [Desulfobacterales bacterium]|nr:chemotaxis protein CheA [Desulfobacterales bacterium]
MDTFLIDKELLDKYKEETYELLAELEACLLDLEDAPDNKELISRVFGAMHTIKGASAMFGFDVITAFAHEVETAFALARDGKIPVNKTLINPTLSACDQIRKMVDEHTVNENVTDEDGIHKIIELLDQLQDNGNRLQEEQEIPQISEPVLTGYHIYFRPGPNIFTRGVNLMRMLNEARELGKCDITGQTDAIPELKNLNPETCYICWNMVLNTLKHINEIKDIFIFVKEDCEIQIDIIDKTKQSDKPPDKAEKNISKPGTVEKDRAGKTHKKRGKPVSNIRIPSDRLDMFMDLVGELVIYQAYLSQKASHFEDAELNSIVEGIERLTNDLRYNIMKIRMLPISRTFSSFRGLVRNLSHELGKEVVMLTEGGDTELDKNIIERLNDPLMHIIRNSIDHGIEKPEIRKRAGKPQHGTIRLSAEHFAGNVLITISDDGAGLDYEAIRAKAAEKGLIDSNSEIPESKIFGLIFTPGISTAKELTKISGRGTGMDVVKRSIENLQGSIEINSQKGIGTVFKLKLPLTLAIIEGLLLKVGDGYFVVPLSVVEECIELPRKNAAEARKQNMMNFRGKIIPYFSLRDIFMAEKKSPAKELVVFLNINGGKVAFGADRIIGKHQTVIKPLNKLCNNVKGISGATILGDGTVALVLDVNHLADFVCKD